MAQFLDLAGLTRFKELLLSKIDSLLALKADVSTVVRTDQPNILTASNTNFISRADTDSSLTLRSAPSGKGACLDLCGNDVTGTYSGLWQLSACNSGVTYNLRGGKDGSLTFRNQHIVRSVNGATADANGNVTISLEAYATKASLSAVATSGSYNDLKDKPAALTYEDFYPVGSVYLTKDASFDPAEKFGGTWVNESGGGDVVIVWHRTA